LAVRALAPFIPLQITELDFEPDGTFPKGVPNPILEESHIEIGGMMKSGEFDFGVAWDGDYDRCFFFDEKGNFVDGYYMVGLLVQDTLENHPGATIIHDPRCIWNTLDICERLGGKPVVCKTGHAFIKEKMRAEDAVYGGEMSAHHYFKEHWFCDSGMLPFLMVARLISASGKPLSELIGEMMAKFPVSGEINSRVADAPAAIQRVREAFAGGVEDHTDGLSMNFENWRFNLRSSNTEPIVRLNIESRGDKKLVDQKAQEILAILRA
jgi:phosphomannomutase